MAAVKANIYPVATAMAIALMVGAWGLGANGDLQFAVECGGVALAAFAVGAWARTWWIVLAVSAAWFFGWLLAGDIAPDTYTGVVAVFAPGVAVFVALGVGAGRQRASRR